MDSLDQQKYNEYRKKRVKLLKRLIILIIGFFIVMPNIMCIVLFAKLNKTNKTLDNIYSKVSTLENINYVGEFSQTINSNYGSKYTLGVSSSATNGKFAIVKNDAGNYVQINEGTTVKINIKGSLGVGSVLTIEAYPGQSNYTVNGEEVGDLYQYTLTQEDFTKGYVELVATSTAYLYSISITKIK